MNNIDIELIWQPDGLLSKEINNYHFRQGQVDYARHCDELFRQGGELVIEAAAGIGKSYAYLVPVLLNDQHRVVISTATRLLQDQLAGKDLPVLLKALGVRKKIVVLKGRRNYFCPNVAQHNLLDSRWLSRSQQSTLQGLLQRWRLTQSAELVTLARGESLAGVSSLSTCSAQDCINQACDFYRCCPYLGQKQQALQADLVITNHHLLLTEMQQMTYDCQQADEADSRKKPADKPQRLLRSDTIVIVDEAHALLEEAELGLAEKWSLQKNQRLLRQIDRRVMTSLSDQPQLRTLCRTLHKQLQNMSTVALDGLPEALVALSRQQQQLHHYLNILQQRDLHIKTFVAQLHAQNQQLKRWLSVYADPCRQDYAYSERQENSLTLQSFPLDAMASIRPQLTSCHSVLYTSATLSNQDFGTAGDEYNADAKPVHFIRIAAPFDYAKQALLFRPAISVHPDDEHYRTQLVEQLTGLFFSEQLKSLFLVTSIESLQYYQQLLHESLGNRLFVADDEDKNELLNRFTSASSGVLLATAGFREGVDLASAGVDVVAIDRLPFESPAQASVMARETVFARQGRNLFNDYQLPVAIRRLRQACGRLIRTEQARGVFVVADPRLYSQAYGALFLNQLPVMRQTTNIEDVMSFLKPADAEKPVNDEQVVSH